MNTTLNINSCYYFTMADNLYKFAQITSKSYKFSIANYASLASDSITLYWNYNYIKYNYYITIIAIISDNLLKRCQYLI